MKTILFFVLISLSVFARDHAVEVCQLGTGTEIMRNGVVQNSVELADHLYLEDRFDAIRGGTVHCADLTLTSVDFDRKVATYLCFPDSGLGMKFTIDVKCELKF